MNLSVYFHWNLYFHVNLSWNRHKCQYANRCLRAFLRLFKGTTGVKMRLCLWNKIIREVMNVNTQSSTLISCSYSQPDCFFCYNLISELRQSDFAPPSEYFTRYLSQWKIMLWMLSFLLRCGLTCFCPLDLFTAAPFCLTRLATTVTWRCNVSHKYRTDTLREHSRWKDFRILCGL